MFARRAPLKTRRGHAIPLLPNVVRVHEGVRVSRRSRGATFRALSRCGEAARPPVSLLTARGDTGTPSKGTPGWWPASPVLGSATSRPSLASLQRNVCMDFKSYGKSRLSHVRSLVCQSIGRFRLVLRSHRWVRSVYSLAPNTWGLTSGFTRAEPARGVAHLGFHCGRRVPRWYPGGTSR